MVSTSNGDWLWFGQDKTFLEADCIEGKVTRLSNKELILENNSSSETTGSTTPGKYSTVEKIVFEKK